MSQLQALQGLLLRELHVFSRKIRGMLTNVLITFTFQMMFFRFFMPALGMETKLIPALFIGNITGMLLLLGWQYGIRLLLDNESHGMIKYHVLLPLSLRKLLFVYITGCMISISTIVSIVGTLGLFAFRDFVQIADSYLAAFGFFFVVSLGLSSLFITLALTVSSHFYMNSMWPRVLAPMFMSGGVYFSWYRIHEFSPSFSKFLLINPMLYCTEGMRALLLVGGQYISPLYGAAYIGGAAVLLLACLVPVVRTKFDFVGEK